MRHFGLPSSLPAAWLLALLLGTSGSLAKPLNVTLTPCSGTNSAASSSDAVLDFKIGFAQLVPNESGVLGPGGQTGSKLLRMNLIGTTGAAIEGFDNTTNKLATLFTTTTVLSAPVIRSVSSLCYALNTNPPTALPAENPTACTIPAGDVALNLTLPLHGGFPLTTLHTTIRIVDTAFPNPNLLSCLEIAVTPYYPHGWYYSLILFLPASLAAAYWVLLWTARCFASWNAAVASDVGAVGDAHSHRGRKKRSSRAERVWSRVFGTAVMSSASGDLLVSSPSLLRFVTPGFRDILWHIQWCSALAQLAVDWPLFVYPIASRGAWASLIGNVTLVQGGDALDKRLNLLATHNAYEAPPEFARQFNDTASPLYLDPNAPNVLLNMDARRGMESWANAVGLRGEDLFGTSGAIFLFICAALILISLAVWMIHAVIEYAGTKQQTTDRGIATPPLSPGMFGAPLRDLNATAVTSGSSELYESNGSIKDGSPPQVVTLPGDHAPGRLKRQWWKFGVKGAVGVFYASSLQGNLIRLLLLFHMPLTAFTTYHFYLAATTTACTLASIVLAAAFFLVVCVLAPAFCAWRIFTVPSGKLYDATRTLMALGPLYNLYGEGQQRYAAVLLGSSLVTGLVVGAVQASGTTQAVLLIVVEIVMGLVTMIWLPWGEGASMGATTFILGVLRTITLVLVLLLTPAVKIGLPASSWIAYAILVIQGVIFLFYLLVLIVKLIEAVVRLIVHAPFDDSTDEFDSGLLGAFSKASCCGEGLLRQSGRRRQGRRRPRGVGGRKNRHSTTASQQGMLNASQSSTLGKSSAELYGQYDTPGGFEPQMGYFPETPDANFSQPTGFIMGGWRPPPPGPYATGPSDYLQMQQRGSPLIEGDDRAPHEGGPVRSFSKVRGGKAAYGTPYTVQARPGDDSPRSPGPSQPLLFASDGTSGSPSPQRPGYMPPPLAPFPSSSQHPHPSAPPANARPTSTIRRKSETAIVDFANPPPHFYHNQGGSAMPSFSQAAHAAGVGAPRRQQQPPTAAFGRDQAEDNDDDGSAYDSDDSTQGKPRRRSWFLRNTSKHDVSGSEDDSARPPTTGDAAPIPPTSRWPFGKRSSRPSTESNWRTSEQAPLSEAEAPPVSAEPTAPRSFSVVRPNRPQQSRHSSEHAPASTRNGSAGFLVNRPPVRGPNIPSDDNPQLPPSEASMPLGPNAPRPPRSPPIQTGRYDS